jgi:tRNA G46 methylase TrmB
MQLDEAAPRDPASPQKRFNYWYAQFDANVLGWSLMSEKVIELGGGKGNMTETSAQRCQKLIVVEAAEANIAIVSKRLRTLER